jgi:murein DD-endopeptidase MepM/ murein hydrolase activator NlpD
MIRTLFSWLRAPGACLPKAIFLLGLAALCGFVTLQTAELARDLRDPLSRDLIDWFRGDSAAQESLTITQRDACPGAPFVLPSDGYIGLLWADPRGPYSSDNPHQGIDIFSSGEPGLTPVYAAYDGYVHRESDWRSTLIMRVPRDPLQPSRQIWLYYTHMADRDGNDFIVDAFEPGLSERFVEQGTLLGYTGDYNGRSPRSIGVHLHFSIVLDDGNGRYTNELDFSNTLDPSPYLGLPVNYICMGDNSGCAPQPDCSRLSPADS